MFLVRISHPLSCCFPFFWHDCFIFFSEIKKLWFGIHFVTSSYITNAKYDKELSRLVFNHWHSILTFIYILTLSNNFFHFRIYACCSAIEQWSTIGQTRRCIGFYVENVHKVHKDVWLMKCIVNNIRVSVRWGILILLYVNIKRFL